MPLDALVVIGPVKLPELLLGEVVGPVIKDQLLPESYSLYDWDAIRL